MPAKDPITWENRRFYIVDCINKVLESKGLKLTFSLKEIEKGIGKYYDEFVEAKKVVSERFLFCDYRSIDRMLKPYKPEPKQTSLDINPKVNQLSMFN